MPNARLSPPYEPRIYRRLFSGGDLVFFNVTIEETDLAIKAERDLSSKAALGVRRARRQIEKYIWGHPEFKTALRPIQVDEDAGEIPRVMAEAGAKAGTGPMAAVAGAVAEYVGQVLLEDSEEVIVENGGDVFLRTLKERTVAVYAGNSPLSGRLGLKISPSESPWGVCTSSGTVGHSLSFGKADAVVVLSRSTPLADATATATCNMVERRQDIKKALNFARSIPGVLGTLVVFRDTLGVWGEVELVEIQGWHI